MMQRSFPRVLATSRAAVAADLVASPLRSGHLESKPRREVPLVLRMPALCRACSPERREFCKRWQAIERRL